MANKLLSELLKGTYSGATAYTVGDIVDYNGSSYACKANTTGNLPTNTTYWALLAEKGATGATGPQGPAGNDGATGPQGPAGTGDVNKVGTPANNQIGVWTGDGTIEGDAALTFDTTTDTLSTTNITATTVTANLTGNVTGNVSGSSGSTTGNAATVTTNANLTGPITSVGNATSIASQTGTGTKFVVDTSPTLVTPVLGVASATSINKVAFTAPATSATIVATDGTTTTLSGGTHSGTNTGDQDISGKLNISDIDDTPVNGETSAPISSNWAFDHAALASSDTVVGHIEVATTAETNTGTDATRAVSPDGLAGSYAGTKSAVLDVIASGTDLTTGDNKHSIIIPSSLNGMDLVAAHARVFTAGTTGTTDIQIHNVTDAVDILSTKITIDSTETTSYTAATAPVINTSNDSVATGDILRVDIDAISTTAPKGLQVILEFRLP